MTSLSLTVAFLTALLSAIPSACAQQPNIVFVLADDLGYRDVSWAGSDIYTPTLDQLAASGVILDNYYVQQTCSPTRSQLLTGRYQIHMGLQHGTFRPCQVLGLPLEFPTVGDLLQAEGYATHLVGKWHLGFAEMGYTPLYRGFDTFYGNLCGISDHYIYQVCDATFAGVYTSGTNTDTGLCGYALTDQQQPAFDDNGTYSTHAYTERAVQIIRDAPASGKPLFLYLAYQAAHDPVQAPADSFENYNNIINSVRREYAGMVKVLDDGIAEVTQALKDTGLWENTILIFSSDNGGSVPYGASNWPLRGQKTGFWEGGLRTRGFVSSPLLEEDRKGSVSRELMHVSDWFPTLAEMAGATLDASLSDAIDGISQWDMIRYGAAGQRTEILHTINEMHFLLGDRLYNDTFDNRMQAALRVGDYKILTGDPDDGRWYQIPGETGYEGKSIGTPSDWNEGSDQNIWLFNVAEDPNELIDLSATMPEKVREMLDRLTEYEATLVPALPEEFDPNCDPSLHGGVWQPWL